MFSFCVLLLLGALHLFSLPISASLLLQHNPTFTCPGGVISCECSGAVGFLRWVIEIDGREAGRIAYDDRDTPGPASNKSASIMSFHALLLSVNSSASPFIFTSVLHATLSTQDVTVTCRDFLGASSTAMLQITGKRLWFSTIFLISNLLGTTFT